MNAKLCGRITDHPAHFWTGHHSGAFDRDGFLSGVEYRCPGHVVVEGGSTRNLVRKEHR